MNDSSDRQELVYPFAEFPADGEVIEVADGIFWASVLVPFVGLRQVNIWLLRDGDGWTMIDSGHGDKRTRDALLALWDKALGGRRITQLILTHFHPDHAGNTRFVAEHWGGLLPRMAQAEWFAANLAVRNAYTDNLSDRGSYYALHGLEEMKREKFRTGALLYADGVRLSNGHRRIAEGDVLTINGDQWMAIRGGGHSPEHMSLYCAERRILIAGDQILPSISTNISVWQTEPEADPLRLFLETCRKFRNLLHPETLILPSHRRPFFNVRQRLRELDLHHADRLSVVLRATEHPVTAGELLETMFPGRPLDGHQIGFAMGEALAHFNHLVERGLLLRLPISHGLQRFQRAPEAADHVGPWFS